MQVEAWGAAEYHAMHRTARPLSNFPDPNANSAKVEKLSVNHSKNLKVHHKLRVTKSLKLSGWYQAKRVR